MKRRSFVLGVSTVVAVVVAATAVAATPFRNNVCKLLTPAQIATVAGLSSSCTNSAPSPGLGATLYTGNWRAKTQTGPQLQVTLAVYTDGGALRLATRNLKQGLSGPPHKVTGIGTAAYAARGAGAAGVHFAVGKYIAYVTLNARVGTRMPAVGAVEVLAKFIVRRLA